MEDLPEVSIIVPAKNEEKYISACLQSLENLNFPKRNYMVYVVDNGSTDDTPEIAKKYKVQLLSKRNGTIASVRNFGAKNSTGDIIAFLDADSIVHPDWLLKGIEILNSGNISAVGFSLTSPDAKSSWIEKTWYLMDCASLERGEVEVEWLSSFNMIVKRKNFEEIGGFNEALETCEDDDFGLRLSKNSKLILSNRTSVKHLGSAKTLNDFFLKELWRGKGELLTFVRNKNKLHNIKGALLPLFYIIIIFISFLLLLFSQINIYLFISFVFSPPMIMGVYKAHRIPQKYYLKVWVLCFTYLLARGLSAFGINNLALLFRSIFSLSGSKSTNI